MKNKIIVLVFALFLSVCGQLYAQNEGVNFVEGKTFAEALQMAKASNKLLFVDCYTSWCGPCKMMATKVFTQKKVGDYFNKEFICIKVDMEKGEGPDLHKRFTVRAYPTFLFIDGDGNEVNRIVGGSDADKFLKTVQDGVGAKSMKTMTARYEAGERDTAFLRKYIIALGGGYRFDKIPEVLDEYCRQFNGEITESTWLLIRRFLSEPTSYAFQFVAENRKQLYSYVASDELEEWIEKVLYAPIFNVVNEAVFDTTKHDGNRIVALRQAIKMANPVRSAYLLAILDYYDAFHRGKINKVLSIYKKQFMNLPANDRFGLTMQLNAMLYAKGNRSQCDEGLQIFRKLFNPNDPILKNFEKSLSERIACLER